MREGEGVRQPQRRGWGQEREEVPLLVCSLEKDIREYTHVKRNVALLWRKL